MGVLGRALGSLKPGQTVLVVIVACNVASAFVYIVGLLCLLAARSRLRARNDVRRRTILRELGIFERDEDLPRPIVGLFHPYWCVPRPRNSSERRQQRRRRRRAGAVGGDRVHAARVASTDRGRLYWRRRRVQGADPRSSSGASACLRAS